MQWHITSMHTTSYHPFTMRNVTVRHVAGTGAPPPALFPGPSSQAGQLDRRPARFLAAGGTGRRRSARGLYLSRTWLSEIPGRPEAVAQPAKMVDVDHPVLDPQGRGVVREPTHPDPCAWRGRTARALRASSFQRLPLGSRPGLAHRGAVTVPRHTPCTPVTWAVKLLAGEAP